MGAEGENTGHSVGPQWLTPRRKVIYAAVVVAVLLFAAEGVLRIREAVKGRPQFPLNDDRALYEIKPYVRFALRPDARLVFHSREVKINSLGFNGPEFAEKKQTGEVRVICAGGSTTFGYGQSDYEHSYPARLEGMLREEIAGAKVVNAGVPGYNSCDSLTNYIARLRSLDADVVVLMHGINDLMLLSRPSIPVSYGAVERFRYEDEVEGFFKKAARYSVLWRKTYKAFRRRPGATTQIIGKGSAALPAKDRLSLARRRFRGNIEMLIATAGSEVRLVLVTFCLSYTPEMGLSEDDPLMHMKPFFSPYLTAGETFDWIAAFNEEIRAASRKHGLPLADAAAIVEPGNRNFCDIVHFTDEGAERLAGIIADAIAENGVLE